MLRSTFAGKTVLVTGHTGFKGSWLIAWLRSLGARVVGIALDPPTTPSHFDAAGMSEGIDDLRLDVRDATTLRDALVRARPDFVFHLAAQALVRRSYAEPIVTWETNVNGTLHLLEALRGLTTPVTAVIITSDKCYDNVEWVWGYRENDALGGPDPYSASKGAAELVIRSHVKSFFPKGGLIRVASARAGNVIGGGDWALDRLIPDCVRAWSAGGTVELRNPRSTRPWQHVLEPLSGYLALAAALAARPELHGEAFNFGPPAQQNRTVEEVVTAMAEHWEQVRWTSVPQDTGPYESGLLKLNCDKALHLLAWQAVLHFEETVRFTAQWYRSYYHADRQTADLTQRQIEAYTQLARERGVAWAR